MFNAGKYPAVDFKIKAKTETPTGIGAGGSLESLNESLIALLSLMFPEKLEPRILEPIGAGSFIFACDRNKPFGKGAEVVLTIEFIYGGAPGEKWAKEWRERIENVSSSNDCPKKELP